jgi:tetratricopeptide (TPR) repeat protein
MTAPPVAVTEQHELLAAGLKHKAAGNEEFKQQHIKLANTAYTQAIDSFTDYEEFLEALVEKEGGKDEDSKSTKSTEAGSPGSSEGSPSKEEEKSEEGKSEGDNKTSDKGAASTPTKEDKAKSAEDNKWKRDFAIVYSNRAFCQIKLENLGSAISDAEMAIKVDPYYPKSYYRLGCAEFGLMHYKKALKAFKTLVKLTPKDADAKAKLKECEKVVNQQRFQASIAVEQTEDPIDVAKRNIGEKNHCKLKMLLICGEEEYW